MSAILKRWLSAACIALLISLTWHLDEPAQLQTSAPEARP
jgi:hypothetical protein